MTLKQHLLSSCLFCLFSILPLAMAETPWTLKQDSNNLLVTVQNKTFRLNGRLVPSWGGFNYTAYGDKLDQSFSTVVKCTINGAAPVWLVPATEKAAFEIIKKDDQRLTIRVRYNLRDLDGKQKIYDELSLVACYHFAKGLPAMATDLILVANKDKVSIAGYSVTYTAPYQAYSVDGKTWKDYKKGGWNNVRATQSYILADKAGQKMLLSPVGGETPDRGFNYSAITDWKHLDMKAKDTTVMSLLVGYPEAGAADKMSAFRKGITDTPQTLLTLKGEPVPAPAPAK